MTLVPRSALIESGNILVLNGTSSSGKTSLCKALQAILPQQYLHIQLDAFRSMEPSGYFSREQAALAPVRVAALCRAMHAAVAEFTAHSQNVILDHVLLADAWHYLFEDFCDQRLYLIGVYCSNEELLRREHARGDRKPGLAQSQLAPIHENREYDFAVDTTCRSSSDCANDVARWLKEDPVPAAFSKMRAQHGVVNC
jgi:chloramphenicol 3-O phosphotransferase